MEAMQRRLQASLEKVAQLVHDELAALLSEAVNTPVDLSHPQFGAVASRVARLTASVETVYRQAAVELIMPHLQFEDADARQEHQLAPGGAEAASALPPKAPGSTAGSKPDGSADHSHLMMRSQSSATRLLSQCTQEGLGMSSEDGDSDAAGAAGPAAGTPAAGGPLPGATSSADRLRKLSPSSLTEGGASSSLPRITSSIAASDIDAMQRLVLVNGAGEERAASVSAAGAKPDTGMGPVSQPLRPTLSTGAQPTSTTSLSSPTGANMADLMFNGSGSVPQSAPWAGSSPAFAAMEAMVVRQAADSQVNSRINSKDGLGMGKDGTMLPPAAPPVPEAITNSLMAGAGNAPAAGSSQQLATQEYLKSVHAALTAANLVMGDAGAMTNLSETIQRAAALNKRDSSASGTASHTASGKLLQLVTNRSTPEQQVQQLQQQHSGRPVSPYTAQSEVQVLSAMDGSGIVMGGYNEPGGSNSARLTPTTSGPVNAGQAGQVQLQVPGGFLTLEEQQQQLLQQQQQQQQAAMMQQLQQQQQQLQQQQQQLQQQQQQQYVVSDMQRGNPQGYAQRTVSAQQLQLPMENLVLSSHRPTHGNAQHGLQVMDLYAQPGQQQNLLTLNSAGMITGMTDGAGNGGGHAMSGPLPVMQGDTLLMEPLTSYVPDPNFSLFDLQPQNAQQVGGYNPNSAQHTLSMFAAAANAENAQVQVRGGHSPHGQPLSQPIDLQGTPSFTTLNLGSVINSAGQLVNISASNNPGGQLTLQGGHGDGVHSEPLPLLVNLNQLGGGTLTATLGNGLPPGTASISAGSLVAGRTAQLSPGASPDPGLMQGQTISLSNLLPGGAARMQGMGLAMQQRAGVSVGALGGNLAGLSVGLAGVPVSPLPLRVQDLPGRFKILPAVVQQRILALCRTNPVIGVRDFDDKVVSKLSLLVDSWGVDQALAMLDHLEHRMRTKQGAMKNGPGYLDVAVCSHLDMLKAQGACPKSMKLEDYAAQVLASPVYHELCQAVNTNRWLAWEHFDQGIVQLIKKLPTESAVEKLQEITYHSFKNVDNIKGCIMSILNSKIREDRRRQ